MVDDGATAVLDVLQRLAQALAAPTGGAAEDVADLAAAVDVDAPALAEWWQGVWEQARTGIMTGC